MSLDASFVLICAAASLGLILAVLHGLHRTRGLQLAGPVHGLIGVTGFAVLLVALRGPARGVAYGAGGFGTMAAVLLALAILAGLLVFRVARRRGDPLFAIGLHATLAIFALALLAAYVSVPA